MSRLEDALKKYDRPEKVFWNGQLKGDELDATPQSQATPMSMAQWKTASLFYGPKAL